MPLIPGPWSRPDPNRILKDLKSSLDRGDTSATRAELFEKALIEAEKSDRVADDFLEAIRDDVDDPDILVPALLRVLNAHGSDAGILTSLARFSERTRNIDYLNDPPERVFLPQLIHAMTNLNLQNLGQEDIEAFLEELATAARMAGRAFDSIAEQTFQGLMAQRSDYPPHLYSYGLFLKTRGRFEEGAKIYERAFEIDPDVGEAYLWNLGICATGARNGELAQRAWQALNIDTEIGSFDLPEMKIADVKVRVAEHPLTQRTGAADDPGLEETIWIERLGPCHGIVRSVMYQDLPTDYGDLVLIDGAPITYHTVDDDEVPVFPHLATLEHRGFQKYDFAATQTEAGQLVGLCGELPRDAVLYVHTEQVRTLCKYCWENDRQDHIEHEDLEQNSVRGRIAAPNVLAPEELLAALDHRLSGLTGARIFAPDLCLAAGDLDRSAFEARKFELLVNQ